MHRSLRVPRESRIRGPAMPATHRAQPRPTCLVRTGSSCGSPSASRTAVQTARRGASGAAVPRRRPATLRSSSTSGQWMPCPSPRRRQFSRWSELAWSNRGNHASGTVKRRPSARSTTRSSSSIATSTARGSALGPEEELMPCLQELVSALDEEPVLRQEQRNELVWISGGMSSALPYDGSTYCLRDTVQPPSRPKPRAIASRRTSASEGVASGDVTSSLSSPSSIPGPPSRKLFSQ